MYTVSITSQGQISIPAEFRRLLGLGAYDKALVSLREGEIVIKPVPDILELAGTFKTKKKATSAQIRAGFGEYLAKQAIAR